MERLTRIGLTVVVSLFGFVVLRRLMIRAHDAASGSPRGASRRARKPSRIIQLPVVRIYGDEGEGADVTSKSTLPSLGVVHPLHIDFSLRVSGVEKWGVSGQDVRDGVLAHARGDDALGRGNPVVIVRESKTGYEVSIVYPDSSQTVSKSDVTRAIEAVDPRLHGRVTVKSVVRD